jgi:tetratricopeptide (TPR) repeat protein
LARYREAAEDSDRPIDQYNLGTALLLEGQVAEAQLPLQQALRSEREVVRESGHYNYGLSTAFDGKFAQEDQTARRSAFIAARQAFREVLRTRPEDADARWNLELVDRWLEEDEQSGGEGSEGGQADSQGGSGAGGAPAGDQGEDQMLSPEEAAALLDQAGGLGAVAELRRHAGFKNGDFDGNRPVFEQAASVGTASITTSQGVVASGATRRSPSPCRFG